MFTESHISKNTTQQRLRGPSKYFDKKILFELFPFLYLEDRVLNLLILTHVLILPMVYGNYKMRDKHVFIS